MFCALLCAESGFYYSFAESSKGNTYTSLKLNYNNCVHTPVLTNVSKMTLLVVLSIAVIVGFTRAVTMENECEIAPPNQNQG